MKRLQRYFLVGLFSIFLFACQDDGEDTLIEEEEVLKEGWRFIVASVGDSESIMALYEYSCNDSVKTINSKVMRILGEERGFKDIKYRNNFIYTLMGGFGRKITQINIEDNFSYKTIATTQFEYGFCIAALEEGVAYIAEASDSSYSHSYLVVKLYDEKLAFERDILLDSTINHVFDAYAVGDFLFLNVTIQSDTSRVDIIDLKSNQVVRQIALGEEKMRGKFSFSDGQLWGSDGYSIDPSTFELTEHQFYAANYSGNYNVSPLLATRGDTVYCFQQVAQPAVLPYLLYAYNISAQEGKYIGDFHDDHFHGDYLQPPIVYQSNCDVLISKGNTNDLLVYQTDGTLIQKMSLPYSDIRTIFFLD